MTSAGREELAGRPRQVGLAIVLVATALSPLRAEQRELTLTAASANVGQPGSPATIHVFRWSSDEERGSLVAALNPPAAAAPGAAGSGALSSPGDRGSAARGARGAGRGRGGARGGRGRGSADAPLPMTPIAALTAAIGRAPTIGYIWTNDVTGYSIKYAYHAPSVDGGERIILATDRRLGGYSPAWKPTPAGDAGYEFTLIEIHLNAKGVGEGKTSLTTKVVADSEARTVALDDFGAAPAILQNVRR